MELPDPAKLWDYRMRLQRAGFRSDEAVGIVTAAVTGYAQTNTVELASSWVDAAAKVVSRCGKACSEMHTFDADCGLGTPEDDS